MNPTLMKAILAMDSYNRGYSMGVDMTGTAIGNATIIKDSSVFQNPDKTRADDDISFYAIAYAYDSDGNGVPNETVISYRGTDDYGLDPITGWSAYSSLNSKPQTQMAFDFYNSVAGGVDPRTANISVTGHSLGGGLAGIVGTVYNKSGVLFDTMTYSVSAANTYEYAILPFNSAYQNSVYGTRAPWDTTATSGSRLTTIELAGQVVTGFIGEPAQLQYNLGYNPSGNSLPLAFDLHSMSSLVMVMYAQGSGYAYQDYASQYFWPVLYSDSFAQSIGMGSIAGTSSSQNKYSDILRTIIAYSAIDEGTRVFGDTAIRALYNDANDLGTVLNPNIPHAATINGFGTEISQTFVEFSGLLALNKVLLSTSTSAAVNGVLGLNSVNTNNSLTINFSDSFWNSFNNGTSYNIVSRDNLVSSVFNGSGIEATIRNEMSALWGDSSAKVFQQAVFATHDVLSSVVISNTALLGTSQANLFVGSSGQDIVTGSASNDLIMGGAGNDIVLSSGGKDIIVGEGNTNTGFDTVDYSNISSYNTGAAISLISKTNGSLFSS